MFSSRAEVTLLFVHRICFSLASALLLNSRKCIPTHATVVVIPITMLTSSLVINFVYDHMVWREGGIMLVTDVF